MIINILFIASIYLNSAFAQTDNNNFSMNQSLQKYLDSAVRLFDEIPEDRKEELKQISEWIQQRRDAGKTIDLLFVCTHNSRRSHLAMIWAAAAADYYHIDKVNTWSGGTEATAFNYRAVEAVERTGIQITKNGNNTSNPEYLLSFGENGRQLKCFSKKFDDAYNTASEFCAVMVCSDADRNCPFVPGADYRIGIPYQDPKISDGTDKEAETYDLRCRQIATEMLYVFSQIQ
jgi:protein-tyrosine-phosphatase